MDNNVWSKIDKLEKEIETIQVQGATNVAIATLEGMQLVADAQGVDLLENVESVGYRLSHARENEPLARNAVKYVLSHIKGESNIPLSQEVHQAAEEFKSIIDSSKAQIVTNAVEILAKYSTVLTHCHSSTTVGALIGAAKIHRGFRVVATETRPLFQGRITAKELVEAGLDVTQITDSASAAFIVDDTYLPVDAVLIGADEVFVDGRAINKVGSYPISIAAHYGNDPLYVLTTLLKIDLDTQTKAPVIEMRTAREVWEDAPKGLNIINPSFDLVPAKLITGFITEAGLLTADQLESALKTSYPWI